MSWFESISSTESIVAIITAICGFLTAVATAISKRQNIWATITKQFIKLVEKLSNPSTQPNKLRKKKKKNVT